MSIAQDQQFEEEKKDLERHLNTETALSVYELNAIKRRAFEAVVWGMPIVSFAAMRDAYFKDANANYNDIVYWSQVADWKLLVTTPNNSSHYVYVNFNTTEEPIVVDLPKADVAGLFGSFNSAWQAPLADIGQAGVDQGKGGKYLITPPGYDKKIPAGYFQVHSTTFNGYSILRVIPKTNSEEDLKKALELIKKIKVYPLSKGLNSTEQKYIDMSGKIFDGIVKFDLNYFKKLSQMINEEPVLKRDLVMMGQLQSLGIKKGSEYKSSKGINDLLISKLEEAHQFLISRSLDFSPYWDSSHWGFTKPIAAQTKFSFIEKDFLDVDERGAAFFIGCAPPITLGKATFYLATTKDQDAEFLAGENTYKLHIPANVPANQFWAITVYDAETAAFIENSPIQSIDSYGKKVLKNNDGSVDVYFGPEAPKEFENNWVYTESNKRWFTFFRFYGPEKPLFDKSWKLPDIEKVDTQIMIH